MDLLCVANHVLQVNPLCTLMALMTPESKDPSKLVVG